MAKSFGSFDVLKVSESQKHIQPRHPGSNPHGCEFEFLLFIKKNSLWGSLPPLSFQKKSKTCKNKQICFAVL
jgi:hypothetical protein